MRTYALRYSLLIFVSSVILAGCGYNRYHQFIPHGTATEDAIEGWIITPRLVRLEEGVNKPIETYSLTISTEQYPAFRRYRLGIDSVEILLPADNALKTQRLLLEFEDKQTEITAFERRYSDVRLPTGPEALYCKLYVTVFNSDSQEAWNRTVDFEFRSVRTKDFWVFKNKAK